MQSITSLESVHLQSYLHVNDCIFFHPVVPDDYKYSIFFCCCLCDFTPVMARSYREELLVSAELSTLRKLNLNRFEDPRILDFFSNFPV